MTRLTLDGMDDTTMHPDQQFMTTYMAANNSVATCRPATTAASTDKPFKHKVCG